MSGREDSEFAAAGDVELHGLWRLADAQSTTPGRFVIGPTRAQLQLEGLLPVASSVDGINLYGELLDGRRVTLLDCGLARRGLGRGERYPERWHVGRHLIGSWLADGTRAEFASVQLSIDGLAQAFGHSGLSVKSSDLTRSGPDDRVTVEWERSEAVVAAWGSRTLTLRPHARLEHESDLRLALAGDVMAVVAGPQPLCLDDVDGCIADLLSLVALLTESAPSVHRIELIPIRDGATTLASTRGRPWYGPRPNATDARLTVDDLGDGASRFIGAWADFRRDQPEAAELLFEYQVFGAVLTPPDRLLYLARFLEAYHRRRTGARANFVVRVTALLEGVGPAARLAYGASAQQLAEAIRDTRNYYVHYNPDDRARAHHGISLDDLADRAWCAVRAVLWGDLGLDEDMIAKTLATDWRYTAAAGRPLADVSEGPDGRSTPPSA